jgi:hypothetical protein
MPGQALDAACFSTVACQKYRPLKSIVYVDELIYPLEWIHFTGQNAKYYREERVRLAAEIRSNCVTEIPNCSRKLAASRAGLTTGNAFALVAALSSKSVSGQPPDVSVASFDAALPRPCHIREVVRALVPSKNSSLG